MKNSLELGTNLLHPICAGAAHPQQRAQENEGGLVWVLWVFYIPSFKPAEGNEMLSLLQHCLCSPVSSSPSPWGSLLGLGTHSCAVPTRHRQSCLGILASANSHFWSNSHCLSASQAFRFKSRLRLQFPSAAPPLQSV